MSNVTQTVIAKVIPSRNTKITNLTISTADTEVTHTLQTNVRHILIRHRDNAGTIKYAWTATESGTKYITVPKRAVRVIENILFASKNLYLQSDVIGIIEIEEFY